MEAHRPSIARGTPGIATPAPAGPVPTLLIEPRQPGVKAQLREMWRYRRLIPFFGDRLLEKVYARSKLGWLWIPLRPILTVGIQALVYGGLLKAPSGELPYILFFLIGMSVWMLFFQCLIFITRSIEMTTKFLRRMYFPRLILPVAGILPGLAFFVVYVVLSVIACVAFAVMGKVQFTFGPETLLILVGCLLAILLALGIGLWTAVLGTHGRDVRWSVQYLSVFWMLVTPVIYPLNEVPAGIFQTLVSINPMTAPVEMVRLGLFGQGDLPVLAVVSTCVCVTTLVGLGLAFFSRAEAASLDNL